MKRVICLFCVGFCVTAMAMKKSAYEERCIYQDMVRGTILPNKENIVCIDQIGQSISHMKYIAYALDGLYACIEKKFDEAKKYFLLASTNDTGLDCMICWLNYIKVTNKDALKHMGFTEKAMQLLEEAIPPMY